VISPAGLVARYRKIHLWSIERDLYRPGDEPVVAPTPWGGLGVLVCYDLWFPELARALVLAGAVMLAVPANWAGNPRMRNPLDAHGLPMGYHMAVTAACANERPVLVAGRIGAEGRFRFLGHSCIVGASGETLAGPLGVEEEGLLVADLPMAGPMPATWQSHLRSRRPEVYSRSLAAEKAS
jgi:predicted amidohydrolase